MGAFDFFIKQCCKAAYDDCISAAEEEHRKWLDSQQKLDKEEIEEGQGDKPLLPLLMWAAAPFLSALEMLRRK